MNLKIKVRNKRVRIKGEDIIVKYHLFRVYSIFGIDIWHTYLGKI